VPPLRDRVEDIPRLARHLLWQSGCAEPERVLTKEVLEVLSTRSWPGNVRELRNVVERAVLLANGVQVSLETFGRQPPEPATREPEPRGEEALPDSRWDQSWLARSLPPGYLDRPYKIGKELLVNQFESLYIGRLFDRHGRNILRIAEDAGIDRHMVRKLLHKHGFEKKDKQG
jgi:DNA-binding NtrC family response regulator